MVSNKFQLIKQLFLAARDLPVDLRSAWLDEHCDDFELRNKVQKLLLEHDPDSTRMETPAFELAGLGPEFSGEQLIGQTIGPFRIESVIGQGGMGVVYRAEQEQPRRTVALKLIRGRVDPETLRRQELETQALARLRHPGIVPVFERGWTAAGSPWFAMEYVEGVPLDRHVAERAVPRGGRLQLFLELCGAVSHAHSKGVIHRDLKPGNVLVCERSARTGSTGSSGRPTGNLRVLDFGLARLTGADSTISARLTEPGLVLGTLAYMSPEQARTEEVDPRGDVYSLGVMLYELMTGRRPLDLEGCWVGEVVARIQDQEPLRPRKAAPDLDPDLETIILKAIEKQPAARYQSVADLADDVERQLLDFPILAHPPSAVYQFQKLVRRHRTVAAVAVLLLVFLLAAGISFGWVEARHVEALTRERDLANALVGFQQRLFQAGDGQPDADVLVADLLDRAADGVEAAFADRPELLAPVLNTLGATYRTLGLLDEAERHLTRALEVGRAHLDRDQSELLEIRNDYALMLKDRGRAEESVRFLREVLEDRRRIQGPEDSLTLAAQIELSAALSQWGRDAEAEQLLRETQRTVLRLRGEDHALALETEGALAYVIHNQGRLKEALAMLTGVLPRMRRILGEQNPVTDAAAGFLVSSLFDAGRLDEAEQLQRDLWQAKRELVGEEHPWALWDQSYLAEILRSQGREPEAEAMFREILGHQERVLGREHPQTVYTLERLALLMAIGPRADQALALFREVASLREEWHGRDSDKAIFARYHLGQMLISQDRVAEGLPLARQALADFAGVMGEAHPDTIFMLTDLGGVLRDLDRLEEAEQLLRRALELNEPLRGPEDLRSQRSRFHLATVLDRLDRLEEAGELYEQLFDLAEGVLSESEDLPALVRSHYGNNLLDRGRIEEAEELLLLTHQHYRDTLGEQHPWTVGAVNDLIRLYRVSGSTERVQEYQRLLDSR